MLVTLVKDLDGNHTSVTTIDEMHLPHNAVDTGHVTQPQGWKIFSVVPEHIEKWGKKVVEEVKAEVVKIEAKIKGSKPKVAKVVAEVKTEAAVVETEVKTEATKVEDLVKTEVQDLEKKI